MACDGIGPSQTCLNLLDGAYRSGAAVEVHADRARVASPGYPLRTTLPRTLSWLPYSAVAGWTGPLTEQRFVTRLRPGDIAYLWPAASVAVHRTLHRRGVPVVLEGINTRMASAKRVLDAAYADLGLPPGHDITQQRIDEEERKLEYATAIFAPSGQVERALAGTPLEKRILRSSYGVDMTRAPARQDYGGRRALTFLFCGFACVRKGMHTLLEAWRQVPAPHRLVIVGRLEPAIERLYGDVLASERVTAAGFQDDVHAWFAQADVFVFPSLEEGDPQVTYEAALHGLPIVATPAGGGRLGEAPGVVARIAPGEPHRLADTLRDLAEAPAARERLGRAARAAVAGFDWHLVGARRAAMLREIG